MGEPPYGAPETASCFEHENNGGQFLHIFLQDYIPMT